jgi:tripartite-type tricarboxylate transporter receptor subunit TctC
MLRSLPAVSVFALTLIAAPAAHAQASSGSAADFYRGKQLTLLLSTGAGGGYALYARPLVRHIAKYIPGEPTVVLQHMEGGGGLRAMNFLYNAAPKDGSVIGMVHNTVAFAPLHGVTQAKFDATKMHWLGTMNQEGTACMVWHKAKVQSFEDLFTKEYIAGSTGPGSDMSIYALAMNRLQGTKIRLVGGYKGANNIYLAMETGEVDGRCGTAVSGMRGVRPHWFEQNLIKFVAQTGTEPGDDPALKGVPLVIDRAKNDEERAVWRFLFASQKIIRPVLTPPGVPPGRVQVLHDALKATMSDPAFVAELTKTHSEVRYLPGPLVQKHVAEIYATPKRVLELAAKATHP